MGTFDFMDATCDVPIVRHDVGGHVVGRRAHAPLALTYDAHFARAPKRRRLLDFPGATVGDGLSVRRSTIPNAGNGLFADRDFPRGTVITKYDGPIAMVPSVLPFGDETTHWASLMRGFVVQGLRTPVVGRGGGSFMNHVPRGANATFVRNDAAEHPYYGIYVKAKRNIRKGDEIFLTYGKDSVLSLAGVT